ncbi:MAG: type II toxin-antitoxin system RelB/DinJ family antitoxin [Spirochaetaceae bacterium]|nr:type II toxin-antitoxin system RelB/DinJ family antitoxin [Spirochaetaceae bacterium]
MTNVTIRLDSDDKAEFSRICEKIGLSVSAAFNVFVKTVIKEERIPFELSARDRDDFYSEANLRHLEELKRLDDAGQLHFVTKTWEELKAMEK